MLINNLEGGEIMKNDKKKMDVVDKIIDMRSAEAESIHNLMVEFPGSSRKELFALSEMGDDSYFRRAMVWIESEGLCVMDGDYYYAIED